MFLLLCGALVRGSYGRSPVSISHTAMHIRMLAAQSSDAVCARHGLMHLQARSWHLHF